MKRDPHKNPLSLTGPWSYPMGAKRHPLEGSFWFVASRLAAYRKANRLERANPELCQMDVLVAKRKEKGLTTELAQPAPAPPAGPETPAHKFVRTKYDLPKRTCRGCGQKKR